MTQKLLSIYYSKCNITLSEQTKQVRRETTRYPRFFNIYLFNIRPTQIQISMLRYRRETFSKHHISPSNEFFNQ